MAADSAHHARPPAHPVAHPFHVDALGGTARAEGPEHVRQMVEQVLFTSPGERVNLPEFGCGLRNLVFLPNDDALAAATRFLVMGALERWLGDLLRVEGVRIEVDGGRLTVDVAYTLRGSGDRVRSRHAAGGG